MFLQLTVLFIFVVTLLLHLDCTPKGLTIYIPPSHFVLNTVIWNPTMFFLLWVIHCLPFPAYSDLWTIFIGLRIFTFLQIVIVCVIFVNVKNALYSFIVMHPILSTIFCVSLDNRAKLTDFGLAESKRQSRSTFRGGEGKGTFPFMAPELFKANSSSGPDYRVDIYAFAVLMYCVFSDKVRFVFICVFTIYVPSLF